MKRKYWRDAGWFLAGTFLGGYLLGAIAGILGKR